MKIPGRPKFESGDIVVCINDKGLEQLIEFGMSTPKENSEYTVDAVVWMPIKGIYGVSLIELVNKPVLDLQIGLNLVTFAESRFAKKPISQSIDDMLDNVNVDCLVLEKVY